MGSLKPSFNFDLFHFFFSIVINLPRQTLEASLRCDKKKDKNVKMRPATALVGVGRAHRGRLSERTSVSLIESSRIATFESSIHQTNFAKHTHNAENLQLRPSKPHCQSHTFLLLSKIKEKTKMDRIADEYHSHYYFCAFAMRANLFWNNLYRHIFTYLFPSQKVPPIDSPFH